MNGDLSLIVPAVAVALREIAGIGTVLEYIPEALEAAPGQPVIVTAWPAVLIEPGEPTVTAKSNTREWRWPIHITVLTGKRQGDSAVEIAAALPWPERIVAKLDSKATFNGLLLNTTTYAEPAVSSPTAGAAVGTFAFRDGSYVGTEVHAICAVERVGGF